MGVRPSTRKRPDRPCHCRNCIYRDRAFISRPCESTTPTSSGVCAPPSKDPTTSSRPSPRPSSTSSGCASHASLPRAGRVAPRHPGRLRGRGGQGVPGGQRRQPGRSRSGDLRRHRAPVLRAGDGDGGGGEAGSQANPRLRRHRRVRRPPGGDSDGGRLSRASRQLPDGAGLHRRAVGPVRQLRHPERPRPGDEDGRPHHRERRRLHAAAARSRSRAAEFASRRSTRSPRPITGTSVRSRSTGR